MQTVGRCLAIFLAIALLSGAVYWLQSDEADWWAYVDSPSGWTPKFRFTLVEQLVISGVVGSTIAVPVTVLIYGALLVWSLTKRRG
jgi:hypothetical protein